MRLPALLLLLGVALASGADASAQADSLRLGPLRDAAVRIDPRAAQPELLARASQLRLDALSAGRRPQIAFSGQGTLQSDVPGIPITLPDGSSPAPPHEQFRAQVDADWALLDGGRTGLLADLERARLAEQAAGVAASLYAMREATTETFFGAILLAARAETLALTLRDLDAQLGLLRDREAEGVALASDVGAVEAELIRVRQRLAEAEADRRAALAVLSDLTGQPIAPDAPLALPDLAADVERAMSGVSRQRPEFARFASTEARARVEADLALAATQPTVSLFGQAGVGRPSPFDFLSDTVKPYALAGVRVRWTPLDWGRSRREADAALLQADIARTEADAFARGLSRQVQADLADIDRLADAASGDARVIALREASLRVAEAQLAEGVALAPAYVDALTDLTEARLTAAQHRIERVYAQARLLSTLGLYPDPIR